MEKGEAAVGPTAAATTAPVASATAPLSGKAAVTPSPDGSPLLTKEEVAAQDAKLRPEREAAFKDYVVRWLLILLPSLCFHKN